MKNQKNNQLDQISMFFDTFSALAAIVVFLFTLIAAGTFISCNPDWRGAEKYATEFSKDIPNARGVSCVRKDTDNDGWCSCTIFGKQLTAVECGCERFCLFNCASGCKLSLPKIRNSK